MVLLSLNIPDNLVPLALVYIPLYLKYKDEVTDEDPESETYGEMIPNPVSKADWIKIALLKSLKEMYKAGKVMDASIDLVQVRVDADAESADMTIA